MTKNMAELQSKLPDVKFVSLTADPLNDTPSALKAYAKRFNAADGWTFLTGAKTNVYSLAMDGLMLSVDEVKPEERENIILWGGGTWEWLDPATAVEAVVAANQRGIDCRLLFLGRSRPNRHSADRRREDRLDALIAGGAPFVSANDSWTPYRDRLAWLRRSKAAIMLHRPTAEAAYSIRTRLFDAIAAAVPVITTENGFAAELVAAEGLGVVVPASDAAAVADGIERLIRDDAFYARCVSNLIRIQPRFAWDAVTRPLIEAINEWQRQPER